MIKRQSIVVDTREILFYIFSEDMTERTLKLTSRPVRMSDGRFALPATAPEVNSHLHQAVRVVDKLLLSQTSIIVLSPKRAIIQRGDQPDHWNIMTPGEFASYKQEIEDYRQRMELAYK
ncbi:MAG: hypothetical protein ACD_83C00054G0002 [uncultured bacterium]|nr:MAG: hypothetical protein ACD_83C00054G0002 [uncultured bacterium]